MFFRILIACLLSWAAASIAGAAAPTDAEIVEQIYRSASEFREKYPGAYSRQNVTVRELDPDNGKLKKTKTLVQEVWQYAGKKARIEILSCSIDGRESDASDCMSRSGRAEPPHRMFGPDGRKHYRFELAGKGEHNEVPVYRLRVIPLKRTKRHFDGELYFGIENQRLIASVGTLAGYPMGVKKLDIERTYDSIDGLTVPGKNKMEMILYLPLVLNLRVVSESIASEQRLLTE